MRGFKARINNMVLEKSNFNQALDFRKGGIQVNPLGPFRVKEGKGKHCKYVEGVTIRR